jgi:hypothetical protein
MNICEQVVEALKYLQAAGMTNGQLLSLHHRSKETFSSAISYWGKKNREPHARSLDYAYRLLFIAREHRETHRPLDVFVAQAKSRWPVIKI